ncbi:MAG: CarD family transcriptional regulator [Oscillospiraceae bacterium]|nr:CarD family transcriptional regulator [Oscillospiraceae bacterium]
MYSVGDKIAHPLHGAGVICDIETKRLNGNTQSYYVLNIPVGNIRLMIPTESAEKIGIRHIVSPEEMDEILAGAETLVVDDSLNWNKRYRENMSRIRSGNLSEVIGVIKALLEREVSKGLSTGERKMLLSAKQICLSEIVLSKDVEREKAEELLSCAMH